MNESVEDMGSKPAASPVLTQKIQILDALTSQKTWMIILSDKIMHYLWFFLVNWFIFSFNFVQSFPLCQTKSPLCQTKHPICWTESMLVQISNIGSFLQLHSTFSKLNSFRHLTQRGQQSPRAPCRPPYTVQMFQPFSTPCHQTHGIERFLMYDSSVRWCVVRKKIGTK